MVSKATAWLREYRANLILWGFPFTGLACLIAYPLLREHRMIAQGGKVVIKASTLTPMLIICLFIFGWGFQQFYDRKLAGKPRLVRWMSFPVFLLALSGLLELLGYDMRFW